MTKAETITGWYLMTQAERNAFVATLVREKIVTSPEGIRLAQMPQNDVWSPTYRPQSRRIQ